MPLLSDYALIPDIFDSSSYSTDEVAGLHLLQLKDVLLSEGVVRDMRDGEWSRQFEVGPRAWHARGRELLKKLRQQNRLHALAACLDEAPGCDSTWCQEALKGHEEAPLTGIIATHETHQNFKDNSLVARIDKLSSAPWWVGCNPSVRLGRSIDEYTAQLSLLGRCANSLMFIDPHLESGRGYRDFPRLLQLAAHRLPAPTIEVHRICYFDNRDKRDAHPDGAGWRTMFSPWRATLVAAGLRLEVFIWDDFHDRYVISDLVGISVPYGFDTTSDPNARTTWTRLSRDDREDVQREFDPSSGRHRLMHRFTVPA